MKHIAVVLMVMAQAVSASVRADTFASQAELLNAAYITGSRYTARELLPVYVNDVGQPVTDERIEAIARRVEEMYRRDGFLIPLVVAQDSTGATPHLHVFEARIAEVRLRGDAGVHREAVKAVAAKIEAEPLLHKARVQRAIQALDDLPGLAVDASFSSLGSSPNAFVLVMNVSYERASGSVALSNRVPQEIGAGLISARVVLNGALRMRERLTLSTAGSTTFGNYWYFAGSVERRFGPVDLDVFASRATAHTQPGTNYDSRRLAMEVASPWQSSSAVKVRPLVGITVRNAVDEDDAGEPWSITRTRTVLAGIEFTDPRGAGLTHVRVAADRSIDSWNAKVFRRNDTEPEAQFTRATMELSHVRPVARGWQLRAAVEGQWSGADLPSGEHFTYGGSQFGRAFDPGTMVADSGIATSLQIERFRRWNNSWIDYGSAFLQVDGAAGWNNGDTGDRTTRGSSTSLGVAVRSDALTTTFELGHALRAPGRGTGKKLRAFLGAQFAL
ncbi:MAG: hypothetical protein M3Y79_02615 [Pseudomonadota bacterium]|nr:hypothetical protein [Pseudomonadota bacterium]